MVHTVLMEDEHGNRKPMPKISKTAASILIQSGKFIARLQTEHMTVIRRAGRHVSIPEKKYHYGGRFSPKNPSGYRGG